MSEEQVITPQNNNYLLGQEEAEQIFLQAWQQNNMHHAWILSGPQGIGKATLAYRIARFLLSGAKMPKSLQTDDKSFIFQQVANNSNPDLMVVEKDYIETDRKKILSAIKKGENIDDEMLSGLKKSAFIRVDDIRKVSEFLSKTSFNDGWRVVIIDSADDMNKNAANALLKILEEPPAKTILLLISHNIGTLLPTIRSRCAKLPLKTLSMNDVASLLRRYRPQLKEEKVLKLAKISGGSIGRAIKYADADALELYEDMQNIIMSGHNLNLQQTLDFCAQAAADADKFAILEELLLRFIKEMMQSNKHIEELYQFQTEMQKMFADCLNINMDKKMMLINLLTELNKVL